MVNLWLWRHGYRRQYLVVIMSVKYPEIEVELVGQDGNAFAILGKVQKALRRANVSEEEIKKYLDEAMSGDYNHLLRTTMEWVEVF